MGKKEEEFLNKLLSMFKVEAKEHVSAITSGLIELEKPSLENQTDLIENIYREAHSLKGAARSVNIKEIESICQAMESVLAALKRREINTSTQLFDVLHAAVDFISVFLTEGAAKNGKSGIKELTRKLESFLEAPASKKETAAKETVQAESLHEEKASKGASYFSPPLIETVRIPTAKLDSLLLQVEELLSVKFAARQRASDLCEINSSFADWKKEWFKVYQNQSRFTAIGNKLAALAKSADYDNRALGGMVDNLLDDMKKVLMLPFSSLHEIFPKLVRDLARDQGKEAELVIQGEDIEIDRRILEELKDPLIHLVRNCIDHGIEKTEERQQKGKPPRGTVRLTVTSRSGSKIEIQVSDDGAGIDASCVKTAALARGIVSEEDAKKLNEKDALSLIFLSGVSTSQIITEVSGRGLGLAIVREKVEKLNGTVSFETRPDVGTTFQIVVPLTLATFRGLLVHLGDRPFIIQTTNVERVVRVKKEEIRTVENREIISLNRRVFPLVSLADVLEIPRKISEFDGTAEVVILCSAEKHIAFIVDEVLHEQEVLVKNLGRQLSRVRNIAGATVLGTGRVVPILNVHDLIKSAIKISTSPPQALPLAARKVKAKKNSILVVDDSITARTLLKNILQSAGYDVKTAVDGMDAFTALKTGRFDIVVSDVVMPTLDGFGLTSKIRSDSKISELPVVLVTSLESRKDKERGVEVGANAYIVKSSFDQSNLLEVIQRLT